MRSAATTTALESPFAVGVPALPAVSTDKQLAIIPPPPRPDEDLARVRAVMVAADRDFASITRGKGSFVQGSPVQKVSQTLSRRGVFRNVGITSAATGVVGGFILGISMSSPITWGVVAALGCGVTPAMLGLKVFAKHHAQAATKNLIPLSGRLADMVTRFHATGGNEKLILGTTLSSWLDAMSSGKALKPAARHALVEVRQAMATLPADERKRVEQLKVLVAILDGKETVTRDKVTELSRACQQLQGSERFSMTRAAIASMQERAADYDGEHALFDLNLSNDQAELAFNEAEALRAAKALEAAQAPQGAL